MPRKIEMFPLAKFASSRSGKVSEFRKAVTIIGSAVFWAWLGAGSAIDVAGPKAPPPRPGRTLSALGRPVAVPTSARSGRESPSQCPLATREPFCPGIAVARPSSPPLEPGMMTTFPPFATAMSGIASPVKSATAASSAPENWPAGPVGTPRTQRNVPSHAHP